MNNFRFLLIFDVFMANPNGDPLYGTPRLLSDNRCMITDKCIKHKIRHVLYEDGHKLLHFTENDETVVQKLNYNKKDDISEIEERARKFIDYRLFGACDLSGKLMLKATGPITIENPVTYNPVIIQDVRTNRSYAIDKNDDGTNEGSGYNNRASFVEYGLFGAYGGLNIKAASKTGCTERDIYSLKNALARIFDNDAATARPHGSMNVRKIICWEWDEKERHSDMEIKDLVEIKLKDEQLMIPSKYEDYEILIKHIEGIQTEIII